MTESLFLILFFLVVNCFFIIIYISRTVFRSIKILEKQTQDIASGKLDTKIDIPINKTNEITSISDSIEKMRLSLIDEENRKNKFIMGISHDLRTPVAIIKGYTEALRDGVITEEEFKNTLTLIDTKANQLNGMIDTLINFVKLETSDWRQNLHNGSITKLIIEFGQNTESTCRVFNRIPLININLNEDFFIPLDPQLVNRVFENLMSNALRYTDENDRISIIAFKQDNKILLKISDTGYGISKTDLNHIFDLFYRGSSSRREEGMGIGLSVVKTIIDTLGWSIGVESIVKEGTTFTITIPL